jgi:hypothetical protein
MTRENYLKNLKEVVALRNRGVINDDEVRYHAFGAAAVIEPEQIMAMVPESTRQSLREFAAQPLPKSGECFSLVCGVVSQQHRTEAERLAAAEAEENWYQGLCRMHAFLNRCS